MSAELTPEQEKDVQERIMEQIKIWMAYVKRIHLLRRGLILISDLRGQRHLCREMIVATIFISIRIKTSSYRFYINKQNFDMNPTQYGTSGKKTFANIIFIQ